MARNNRQSQPRKNDRNNRQQSSKKNIRRRGRNDNTQETLRTADRSGNKRGISSPPRRSAAREDDERMP